ncbi:unnamed protein product [Trifolium pratense]|uniref:Uncharacterized protein n=1 Tax=Trifolium pratense TaxID=57577 RepID=A0ACB0KUE7_TRIPR|nr:unnamed protein product [Trifolium pratense]
MADEIDAIVQRILEEEEEQDNKEEEEQEEENKEVVKKEEEKKPDEDKRKRKNRRKKEKRRAAKDRKICAIYIQSVKFSIEQSVQEEEEKDKWKKMWREIQTGKRQSLMLKCIYVLQNVDNAGQPMPGEEQEDIEEEEKDNGKKVLMEFPKTENRQRLISVTLGNKIFAFGGNTQVGQVYDTSKNKPQWEDMTTTPFLDTSAADFSTGEVTSRCPIVSHPAMSDPKNNRLILYFEDQCCLYAYYPDNDKNCRWECLDNDLKTLPLWNQQLVDDVIYYFGPPYTFLAYDITQRKWLNVSWPEKKLQDCDMFFTDMTQMIHLGDGIMCLAISYPHPASIGPLLQFLRFRVSRVDDDHVQLTPISCHRFKNAPGRGWIFTPF